METGVYKIYLKAKPAKFYIVGSANFEAYWREHADKSLSFSLIRECQKQDLKKYTEHFIEKFKPTWNEKEPKVETEEIETAVVKEPVSEQAIIPEKIRKPRVKSKSKK